MTKGVGYHKRRKDPGSGPKTLSPRQNQIVQMVMQGLRNDEIAKALRISRSVVKNHLTEVYARIGVYDRTELVVLLMNKRIAELEAQLAQVEQPMSPPLLVFVLLDEVIQ